MTCLVIILNFNVNLSPVIITVIMTQHRIITAAFTRKELIKLFVLYSKVKLFLREIYSILALYLSVLLVGFSAGFSAVSVPDMKAEMRN